MGEETTRSHTVVIGHGMGHGQPTTAGHLICRRGGINRRTIGKREEEAAETGEGSFTCAWASDRLEADRERAVAVDISLWQVRGHH